MRVINKQQPQKTTTQVTKPVVKQTPIAKIPAPSPLKFTLLLFIVAILTYCNTFQNGYVLDDLMMVAENRIVHKGIAAIPEIFSTPYLKGYMSLPNDNYRPISLVTLAIETQFFGVNPVVNHTVNVFLFGCCVALLFLFLYYLFDGKRTGVAFVAALLFAVHPIHTEVVANVKSRDELLCFLFGMSSLILFLRYAKSGKILVLITGAVCYLLSLLSKETTITFLAIIPLIFLLNQSENKTRSIVVITTSVISAGIFLALRYAVLTSNHANNSSVLFFIDNELVKAPGLSERLATPILVLGQYIWMMLLPHPLVCSYAYNSIPIVGFGNPGVLLSTAIYLGLTGYAVYRLFKNRKDLYALGILFWMITISIVSNLFFLIAALKADRFLFFPSVGFCLIFALLVEWAATRSKPGITNILRVPLLWMIMAPACVLFIVMTINRNAEWKDNYTLALADVQKVPDNARLNFYLGNEMSTNIANAETDINVHNQIISESIPYLEKAVSIFPRYDVAHTTLGMVFLNLQMLDSAEVHHKHALADDSMNVIALNGLAGIYFMKKNYAKAKEILLRDVAINPNNPSIVFNLGNNYLNLRVFDSAMYYYRKALAMQPNQIESLKGMAIAFYYTSQKDSGDKYFAMAKAINPAIKL